jgi:hypothetical protein
MILGKGGIRFAPCVTSLEIFRPELVQNGMSKLLVILQERNSIINALQTIAMNNFRRLSILNKEKINCNSHKNILKIIINNKSLLSDYYTNKDFLILYCKSIKIKFLKSFKS